MFVMMFFCGLGYDYVHKCICVLNDGIENDMWCGKILWMLVYFVMKRQCRFFDSGSNEKGRALLHALVASSYPGGGNAAFSFSSLPFR
jgi:hypothetical protein